MRNFAISSNETLGAASSGCPRRDDRAFLHGQRFEGEIRVILIPGQDRHVGRAGGKLGHRLLLADVVQPDLHTRMRFHVAADDRHQRDGRDQRRRGERHPFPLVIRLDAELAQQNAQVVQGRLGGGSEAYAFCRDDDVACRSPEQRGADAALQPLHPAGHRRLREAQRLGGAAEASRLGDGQEGFEVLEAEFQPRQGIRALRRLPPCLLRTIRCSHFRTARAYTAQPTAPYLNRRKQVPVVEWGRTYRPRAQ